MIRGRACRIDAPAKVNLGLEILGRRPDGFHEIRTIMAMIDLADVLSLSETDRIAATPIPGVAAADNLVVKALAAIAERLPDSPTLAAEVNKRIPMAAGLGGASSDAAAALQAANALLGGPLDAPALHRIAADLGSDVPFFLTGPCALSTGRGTDLSPLPPRPLSLLLIVPRVQIPGKTRLLYSLLQPEDFSDGSRIDTAIRGQADESPLTTEVLSNAFSRALCQLEPEIAKLQEFFTDEIGFPWALSGAGPAHYVVAPRPAHNQIQLALGERFPNWLDCYSVQTLEQAPSPRIVEAASAR